MWNLLIGGVRILSHFLLSSFFDYSSSHLPLSFLSWLAWAHSMFPGGLSLIAYSIFVTFVCFPCFFFFSMFFSMLFVLLILLLCTLCPRSLLHCFWPQSSQMPASVFLHGCRRCIPSQKLRSLQQRSSSAARNSVRATAMALRIPTPQIFVRFGVRTRSDIFVV